MRIFSRFLITSTLLSLTTVLTSHAADCNCVCRGRRGLFICDSVEELWKIGDSHADKLMEWEKYKPFVKHFSERWRQEIADIVDIKMNEFIAKWNPLPKPENLVSKIEDSIENDVIVSKPSEESNDLVNNLIAKVEMVENRTMEVEEELRSERRVRRHLEQEVNETRSSLNDLGVQLQNVTAPVDSMMSQVQLVIFSSLEDMNKTIYEDHLKKLYYKVEGVVYKNETEKLGERLQQVETELHVHDNSRIVSKLAEDLKVVEENLLVLNNSIGDTVIPRLEILNTSVGDILVPRIETLENETVRKNVVEELGGKMADILNSTELFKTSLIDVWSEIQDIRDFERKFQDFSIEWNKSLETLQNQIVFLKNKTEAINKSQLEPKVDDSVEIAQSKVFENILQDNGTRIETDSDYTDPEIAPFVVNRSTAADDETSSFKQNKSSKLVDTPSIVDRYTILNNVTEQPIEDYYPVDYEDIFQTLEVDRSRIKVDPNKDVVCNEKPDLNDPHLLVDVVQDSSNRNKLKFGCRPIGLYSLLPLPVPPRCHMGSWVEPFPSCRKLPDISEIETLADELLEAHPCSIGSGEFPDPFNCSQFFKCSFGKLTVFPCPGGLHFDPNLKVCAFRRADSCRINKNSHEKELELLVPPIHIESDNVDKPSSHLGTGPTGQLIVHPRSSFTLHCLYPENIWGYPSWNVTYVINEDANHRVWVPKKGKNRVSLSITTADVEDSGIYKCVTPFGVQNTVEVVVKAVICPAFDLEDEYEDVFYRPTPEGEQRIMGTAAEFICEDGSRIVAHCMADGKWSRGPPSDKECTLKKRNTLWNCQPFDLSRHPDLIVERNDMEKILTFKCAGRKRLVGNSFTRCRDDGVWSHVSLPRCKG